MNIEAAQRLASAWIEDAKITHQDHWYLCDWMGRVQLTADSLEELADKIETRIKTMRNVYSDALTIYALERTKK